MHDLDENDYRELARVFRTTLKSHAPSWTGGNDPDPGTALLELMAFISESFLTRGDAIPERGRLSAARLAEVAPDLAGGKWQAQGCTLARNRF